MTDDEDLWSDEISAIVDAAFETVSRNPSDHEEAFAYRRAIATALRRPTQSDALLEGDAQTILYLLGVRRGREDERAKIVAWLMREEDDYPSGKYSVFAAIIREEIEAGEHLK